MVKVISVVLLASGIALAIFGMQAMNSKSSIVSKFFNGTPTNAAMELMVAGIVAIILGVAGFVMPRRFLKG
ncbi:MAG: DUF3185 family protein [Leptospirillum sp.]